MLEKITLNIENGMKFTLENVSKWKWIIQNNGKRSKLKILDDISIETCGEQIHAILGPSGSGKTSLLRLLNKLENCDAGKILFNDVDIANIPSRILRKDIGMVFQVPALFQGNVSDNILFGPRIHKKSMDNVHVEELLHIVGLDDIQPTRNIEELSVGEQQRIAFARALANEPKILVLDEPTSALDPTAANKLLDLIKYINHKLGIGIILVTHIMQHAQRIAGHVSLLVDGKKVEHGPANLFFRQPQTEIGQKFICGEL